jgi:hypothetical protein
MPEHVTFNKNTVQTRLGAAITEPGELVVDPAAGSFVVVDAAHPTLPEFIGRNIAFPPRDGNHASL